MIQKLFSLWGTVLRRLFRCSTRMFFTIRSHPVFGSLIFNCLTGYMLGVMVTGPGNAKETPHMWIDHPKNSVVFKVNADGRMIKSTVFASSHSLRFPRVDIIRWDKLWHDVLSVEELKEQVAAAQQPETIR